jgi:hypothetical protein
VLRMFCGHITLASTLAECPWLPCFTGGIVAVNLIILD